MKTSHSQYLVRDIEHILGETKKCRTGCTKINNVLRDV